MKGISLEAVLADLRGACEAPTAPEGELAGKSHSSAPRFAAISADLVNMALKGCYDPEINVNIVDLGLVRSVEVDGNSVRVQMTLTAPGCPMGDTIVDEVRETLRQLPGVEQVTVGLAFDPPWSPDSMTEDARRQLGLKIA